MGINDVPEVIFFAISKDIARACISGREVERPALECRLLGPVGSGYGGKVSGFRLSGTVIGWA